MTPRDVDELEELLRDAVDPAGRRWLARSIEEVRRDPGALPRLIPAVGRHVGRQRLQPRGEGTTPEGAGLHDWTVDDAGRVLLLVAAGPGAWHEIEELYRFGDAAERRGILRSLHLLPVPGRNGGPGGAGGNGQGEIGLRLVDDAIRTNDPRLLAAALGPFAVARLDERAFNQAVLKCVFVGVRLAGVEGLAGRATPRLARMLAAYAHERVAAGRDVPPDIWPLVEAHPPHDELAAIEAEREHPVRARRAAAAAALAQREQSTRRAGRTRGRRDDRDRRGGNDHGHARRDGHGDRDDGGTTCASSSPTST
jgi:hypothetical protein